MLIVYHQIHKIFYIDEFIPLLVRPLTNWLAGDPQNELKVCWPHTESCWKLWTFNRFCWKLKDQLSTICWKLKVEEHFVESWILSRAQTQFTNFYNMTQLSCASLVHMYVACLFQTDFIPQSKINQYTAYRILLKVENFQQILLKVES
jgi:hypothetical protein